MPHLVRRFFGFVVGRPLTPAEQAIVASELRPELALLFFGQRPEDQRHAFTVAEAVRDRPELVEAALLHDVGKTATGLGAVGRSLATIWAVTRLPMPSTWRRYLDHGPIGADLVRAGGAGDMAVAFARHHPGTPPAGIDPSGWRRLEAADAT